MGVPRGNGSFSEDRKKTMGDTRHSPVTLLWQQTQEEVIQSCLQAQQDPASSLS